MSYDADVETRVSHWVRDVYGASAEVRGFRRMPGNSGFSYGFAVSACGSQERLVLRLPPPGSNLRGVADVLHQATVLRAMRGAGVPVPEVRWSGDENPWFQTPFFASCWVDGESTHMFDAEADQQDGAGLEDVFRSGMRALAAIHDVPWESVLPGWSEPRSLTTEVTRWVPTVAKSGNDDWIRRAGKVAERLEKHTPATTSLSVLHGDFYSNNWLFADGEITAVLDWELSGIGAPGLDLGWICMMYDTASWGPSRHMWSAWNPSDTFLVEEYLAGGGRHVDQLEWYRALSGYRLACITGRNYSLHVSGKRPDPAWDIVAESVPYLFDRADELLS